MTNPAHSGCWEVRYDVSKRSFSFRTFTVIQTRWPRVQLSVVWCKDEGARSLALIHLVLWMNISTDVPNRRQRYRLVTLPVAYPAENCTLLSTAMSAPDSLVDKQFQTSSSWITKFNAYIGLQILFPSSPWSSSCSSVQFHGIFGHLNVLTCSAVLLNLIFSRISQFSYFNLVYPTKDTSSHFFLLSHLNASLPHFTINKFWQCHTTLNAIGHDLEPVPFISNPKK
jgi:hypothetical protein